MEYVLEILDDQRKALEQDVLWDEGESRKQAEERLQQVNAAILLIEDFDKEKPGVCDVLSCENEVSSQGFCWRDTGYWCTCSRHFQMYRDGHPVPEMTKEAIEREKRRGDDGVLIPKK